MVEVYVAKAFSKDGKGGNRAGVVLDSPDLTFYEKAETAKKLGYSETVFVSASRKADLKLEYFTTTGEVPLCGHATIAAFSVLRLLGRLDRQSYKIEAKAGILNIQIKEGGLIFMEQNRPVYLEVLSPDIFAGCLEEGYIDRSLPIQTVSTGLHDIMLPVDSREHLEQLSPNLNALAELSRRHKVVGLHAFTLRTGCGAAAVCRNFAPLYGIDEESATGTASCALACYLFRYYQKKSRYIFEQGHNLGEVSQIAVDLSYDGDVIHSVCVGGYGYLSERRKV